MFAANCPWVSEDEGAQNLMWEWDIKSFEHCTFLEDFRNKKNEYHILKSELYSNFSPLWIKTTISKSIDQYFLRILAILLFSFSEKFGFFVFLKYFKAWD